jgi:hypothetical protein
MIASDCRCSSADVCKQSASDVSRLEISFEISRAAQGRLRVIKEDKLMRPELVQRPHPALMISAIIFFCQGSF